MIVGQQRSAVDDSQLLGASDVAGLRSPPTRAPGPQEIGTPVDLTPWRAGVCGRTSRIRLHSVAEIYILVYLPCRIEADAGRRVGSGPLGDVPTEALKALRDALAKANGGAGPAKRAGAVNPDEEIPTLREPRAAKPNSP
jgi:hypothetical protein